MKNSKTELCEKQLRKVLQRHLPRSDSVNCRRITKSYAMKTGPKVGQSQEILLKQPMKSARFKEPVPLKVAESKPHGGNHRVQTLKEHENFVKA